MIRSFFTTILLSISLFSQSEAYDALKVLEPFIGEWYSKHKSIGVFEGLPNNKEIISTTKYEWITDKSAVLETWRSTSVKNEEKIAIFADYDCDGIPGAVILYDFLKKIGPRHEKCGPLPQPEKVDLMRNVDLKA